MVGLRVQIRRNQEKQKSAGMQHLTTQILMVPGQILVFICKNLFCNCTAKYQREAGTLSGYHKIVVQYTMRATLGFELHLKLLIYISLLY